MIEDFQLYLIEKYEALTPFLPYLAIALAVLILGVLLVCHGRKKRISMLAKASFCLRRSEVKTFSKNFSRYVRPNLADEDSGRRLSYGSLRRRTNHSLCTLVLGECGEGKTSLLLHLAHQKKRGALYYPVAHADQGLDSLLYHLRDRIKDNKKSRITIFVDDFHRLREFARGKTGEEVLSLFLEGAGKWDLKDKEIHIVVSSYAQIFKDRKAVEGLGCFAVRLQPLSKKQILKIYSSLGKTDMRYGGIYKVPDIIHSKNRLKHCMNMGMGPVLSNPFFISYLDVLFAYESAEAVSGMDFKKALDIILGQYWIVREYNVYLRLDEEDTEKCSMIEYRRDLQSVLILLIKQMADNRSTVFWLDRFPEEYRDYLTSKSLIFCKLMRRVDKKEFRFEHDFILEFFMSEYLANQDCTYNARYCWLKQIPLPNIGGMYVSALGQNELIMSKLTRSLARSEEGDTLFERAHLEITDCPRIVIQCILAYLVNARTFTWRGMEFDRQDTEILASEGDLDLEGRGITNLSLLNYVGFLREIHLEHNQVDSLIDYRDTKFLRVLDLTGNPFHAYEQLSDLNLDKLLLTVGDEWELRKVLKATGAKTVIIDVPNLSPLYQTVAELREKEGRDVSIRRGIITSKKILLHYLRIYHYPIRDFIQLYAIDCLRHETNRKRQDLLMVLAKTMSSQEMGRTLEQTMIHMLAEMTVFDRGSGQPVPSYLRWEEADQGMALMIGETLAKLHLAAYHFARKEYDQAIRNFAESKVIISYPSLIDPEQQQSLILTVCRFVPMEIYYDLYVKANQEAGNVVEEMPMPMGDLMMDTIFGELKIRAFFVHKEYDDPEEEIEELAEEMA